MSPRKSILPDNYKGLLKSQTLENQIKWKTQQGEEAFTLKLAKNGKLEC